MDQKELEMLRMKSTNDDHEYTSLRDIASGAPLSQVIMIRNQLVSRAASAYVQSAFLGSRKRGGLAELAARFGCQIVFPLHVVFRFVNRVIIGVRRAMIN